MPLFTVVAFEPGTKAALDRNTAVLGQLVVALRRLEGAIMAGAQEFRDLVSAMNQAVDNLADDIRRLTEAVGQPGDGGLDAAETDEVRGLVGNLAERLSALAAVTPEPPVEPPAEG